MQLDRTNMRKIAGLILLGVVAGWLLGGLQFPQNAAAILWGLALPFVLGFIIAFLLDIPMDFIGCKLLKGRGGRLNRVWSLLIVLLLFFILLGLFFYLLVPQLASSIATLAKQMPGYIKQLQTLLAPLLAYVPSLQGLLDNVSVDWGTLTQKAAGWLQSGGGQVWSTVAGFASSFFGGIATFFIGLFFAFNVVLGKNHWIPRLRQLLRAYLPDEAYARLHSTAMLANSVFRHYITGQCLEALIVGLAYLAVLGIGGFPYALLISVLTALASFVPIFGVYIAFFIGLFLILVSAGFWRAVVYTAIFLVLQQIEGNIVYPRIVGSAVGLSPGWVLVAVALGGSLFGVAGILFFIPLLSVVYKLVYNDAKRRLARKEKRGKTS